MASILALPTDSSTAETGTIGAGIQIFGVLSGDISQSVTSCAVVACPWEIDLLHDPTL
jgi:hypothetical protein